MMIMLILQASGVTENVHLCAHTEPNQACDNCHHRAVESISKGPAVAGEGVE
jgi:hypothetical protein